MKAIPCLPAISDEGDLDRIGQLGAYRPLACAPASNGFDGGRWVEVADPPMLATP